MQPHGHACVYGAGSTQIGDHPMKKIVALSIIAAALAVSACNTISGVGRDVSAAGSAVTGGAESAKR